jgi:pimeloyl-ACP methyl ester carboxylesterase
MKRRIWTITKRILLSLVGLVLLLAGMGLAYRAYRLHQIAKAVETKTGINEAMFVRIGGIDQWITIRGQDQDNPVLFFLHGGPGFASLSLNPRAFLGWEKDFTLVQWDQRGAGKTYGQSGPLDPAVTIDRMALDGVEVAEYVRRKLHKQKVVLVGLSWGTILGVYMARARPDLFSAYVGTGQITNWSRGRAIAYAQLMAEARARNDRAAVQELEAIGPPPYDSAAKDGVHTKWATAYEPGNDIRSMISTVLFDSAVGPRDIYNLIKGLTSSDSHFHNSINAVDLPALGTDFDIPFFIFQGTLDNITPASPLRTYIATITAPQKQLVLIAGAGHNVMVTRSDEFLRLLIEWVRPLAIPAGPIAGSVLAQ